MPARRDPGAVKPVSGETEARIERMARLRRETIELSELLAEGARLVNRPHDDAKDRFVRGFLDEARIDSFPVISDDLRSESDVEWSHDLEPTRTSVDYVVSQEIDRAFRQAGAEPPAITHTIAAMLLGSDTGIADGTLSSVALSAVSVELVLAHIEALGFRWPKRVKLAVARRVTIVLLNRMRFECSSWFYDERADEWERNRTEETST